MTTTDNKLINGSGLSALSSQIKSFVENKITDEVYVGATIPTDDKIKLWVDTNATPTTNDWKFIATEETLGGTITLDKTFAEIQSAYQSKKNIICLFNSPRLTQFGYNVAIMPLMFYGESAISCGLSIAVNNTIFTLGSLVIMENSVNFYQPLIYLNDYITENNLNSRGYQTEAQVNALINSALGVIENGTY